MEGKTVFIVGAGAGVSYKMPTGIGLTKHIVNEKTAIHTQIRDATTNPKASSWNLIFDEFHTEFKKSTINSIDAWCRSRARYSEIAKAVVASAIAGFEKSAYTFNRLYDREKWLAIIYNRIHDKIDPNPKDRAAIDLSNLEFIVFNYDRIIEFFFVDALSNTFPTLFPNMKPSEVLQAVGLQVRHVYGVIRDIDSLLPSDNSPTAVKYFVDNGIGLIGERVQDESVDAIRASVFESERVFILGFGFDRLNCELLNLPETLKGKEVFSTGLGMSEEIMKYMIQTWKLSSATKLIDCDCEKLILDYFIDKPKRATLGPPAAKKEKQPRWEW